MLIRPHFILFISLDFFWCCCCSDDDIPGLVLGTPRQQRHNLFILLAQLFDSLIRSNFKWYIIFDAVHGGANLVEPFVLILVASTRLYYNHHFTLSFSKSHFFLPFHQYG